MHNITYIIEEVLALDKSIVLKFPSKEALKVFKSMLSTYISRYNKKLAYIGASDIFEGKIIHTAYKSEDKLVVELSLKDQAAVPSKPIYEIVEIKEAENESDCGPRKDNLHS